MASPPIRPFSARASPVSGAATAPTSWALRTSRAGSRAIACTLSALSRAPSSSPPLKASVPSVRPASASALAARATSPRTNASAVGPSSTAFSPSAQARAQLRRLGDGESAVVDRDHGCGLGDLRRDLLDCRCLLLSVHRFSRFGGLLAAHTWQAVEARDALGLCLLRAYASAAGGLGQVASTRLYRAGASAAARRFRGRRASASKS